MDRFINSSRNRWFGLTLMACLTCALPAKAKVGLAGTTVLLIRHAEKPTSGNGLSEMGLKRANAYVSYFKSLNDNGRSLTPETLIATADSKASMRPGLTLKPLGDALHLRINLRFKNKDYKGVVQAIKTEDHGKVILIAWHHGKLAKMITAFGADATGLLPSGKWPNDTYDWVIELPFDRSGHLIVGSAKRFLETDVDAAIAK